MRRSTLLPVAILLAIAGASLLGPGDLVGAAGVMLVYFGGLAGGLSAPEGFQRDIGLMEDSQI